MRFLQTLRIKIQLNKLALDSHPPHNHHQTPKPALSPPHGFDLKCVYMFKKRRNIHETFQEHGSQLGASDERLGEERWRWDTTAPSKHRQWGSATIPHKYYPAIVWALSVRRWAACPDTAQFGVMMITSLYFRVRMQLWYTYWLAWFLKIKLLKSTSPAGTSSDFIVWSLPNFPHRSNASPAVSWSSLSSTRSFTEWQVKVSVSCECKVKSVSWGEKKMPIHPGNGRTMGVTTLQRN